MKKLNVIITIIIALTIVSCASVEHEKSEAMELVYETDFSSDDGDFKYGGGEINEIQKGVLHLKKGKADRTGRAGLKRVYGNNSTTTFRIKFGEPVFAHINFLQRERDALLMCFFNEKRLDLNSYLDGNITKHTEKKINVKSGRWYDVAVSIIDYSVTVSIDGVEIGTIAVDNRLLAEGYMNFECHEDEFWVDDLRIVAEPSGIKEQPVAISWGSVLYETDFSRDDGGLDHDPPGKINEISKGVLHLKGIKDGQASHAGLKKVYGNNSITTFRIKFGERYKKEGSFADVNFLWKDNDRVKTSFCDDAFFIWTGAAGQGVDLVRVPANFTTDRWYDIQVTIADYNMSVTIDGRLLKTLDLDERLPSQGHLNFECHDEYWVDDLKVVAEKVERVVERKPEEKKVEREAEKVEIQRKLSDSRIAVVGIKTEDDQEKTAAALVSFVIDAFVNVGIGKIMERQDISKILEEYEFQREDITDQSTAIEIGRLAGADVISIGALYKLGSKHYLNIKLISVKTGEIVASCVATAETEDDYFDMCNEAVKGMLR